MKIKDLSNKVGGATKGFVEIRRGSEKITQMTFKDFSPDQAVMAGYLDMAVNFFNIEVTEKNDIFMTIQVN